MTLDIQAPRQYIIQIETDMTMALVEYINICIVGIFINKGMNSSAGYIYSQGALCGPYIVPSPYCSTSRKHGI